MGQKYMFQPCRNDHTASAVSDGRTAGSTIVARSRRCPQPSMRAASASSAGNCRNACRIRKTPNPLARNGSTRLHWLFSTLRLRMNNAFGTTIAS